MENEKVNDYRRYYLNEFSLYDGDHFVTFNIVDINAVRQEIIVAVSDEGRISVCTLELKTDKDERLYFEYGPAYDKIAIDDFEKVREENRV